MIERQFEKTEPEEILIVGFATYDSREYGQVPHRTNINPNDFRQLPMRSINFINPKERKLHDDLVVLVDAMLDLNKKIQAAKGSEKDQIQRQIEKTDREIDDILYKLYGITEEERKIIERRSEPI